MQTRSRYGGVGGGLPSFNLEAWGVTHRSTSLLLWAHGVHDIIATFLLPVKPHKIGAGLLKSRSDWRQAPPPQMIKERAAGLARPRQTGRTLFSSFFRVGRGRGKRLVRSPEIGETALVFSWPIV